MRQFYKKISSVCMALLCVAALLIGCTATAWAADEIDDSVKSISCDGKYVCVLTSGSLLTYNLQGEKIGEKSVNSDAERCCISGGSAYVLFSKQIEKYSSIGINTSDAETTN